jgi:hypothetical protein
VVGELVGLGGDAAPGPRAVVQVACGSWWQCHGQLERALAEVIGPQGPIFVCPVAPFLDERCRSPHDRWMPRRLPLKSSSVRGWIRCRDG